MRGWQSLRYQISNGASPESKRTHDTKVEYLRPEDFGRIANRIAQGSSLSPEDVRRIVRAIEGNRRR